MLGRLVLPLNFYEEGREIQVREIADFKKYFNNRHILELLRALDSGKLEQFFYGNGKDEISNLIIELRKKGVEEVEILNAVAEKIGCEKLSEELVRKIKRLETSSFVELLLGDDDIVELTKDELTVDSNEVKIYKNKILKSFRESKTKIFVDSFTLKSENKNSITFKNLELSNTDKTYQFNFEIKNCRFIFENVTFSNFKLKLVDADVDFVNCKFKNGKIESLSCRINAKNCEIEATIETKESKFLIENSKIRKSDGLHLIDTTFKLSQTEISECGVSTNNQVKVVNSSGDIVDSKIHNGVPGSSGLYLEKSKVEIKRTEIFEHKGNGLEINQSSEFLVEKSKIHSNGGEIEDCSQIKISYSKGEIIKTEIYKGVGSSGIKVDESDISIQMAAIYQNMQNGIVIKNSSDFKIENSKIHSNGTEGKGYSQIWIENSKGEISNTEVFDSLDGIGIWLQGSEVSILNVKVANNRGNGIVIKDCSRFMLSSSQIHLNGTEGKSYPQIWIENSKGEISNTEVFDSLNGTGIYLQGSEVSILNVKVANNRRNGIQIKNCTKFMLSSSQIHSNGTEGKSYPQIWIENSKGEISNTEVFDSLDGIGIWLQGSEVSILNVRVANNRRNGIGIEDSRFLLSSSQIHLNGTKGERYPQIWIKNSKGEISHSSIYQGYFGGIWCNQNSIVKITYSQICKNKEYGIKSENSFVTLSFTKTWENKVGIKANSQNVSYDNTCEIKDGREDLSLCFITTAVIRMLGKDDNCIELKVFRKYRDNYLLKQEDGEFLVSEYYRIAPQIIEAIEFCDSKESIYLEIWHNYLKPCLSMIEAGDLNGAKSLYIKMIDSLKSKFLVK